jgi:tetratricopeptide (TPR) repeat protein
VVYGEVQGGSVCSGLTTADDFFDHKWWIPPSDLPTFKSMPLEQNDLQHLKAAHGYIELGMFLEANAELEEIDPFCRVLPDVLYARLAIYQGLEKWEAMAAIANRLVEWNPNEPGYFVDLAYATRRAESLSAAHAILLRGEKLHPKEGTIQFNLACYETQLGNIEKAKQHLKNAIAIHPQFKMMALEDKDLEPLRASLVTDE